MTVHEVAVVDTSIIAAIRLYEPSELPDTMLVTAVTLGESLTPWQQVVLLVAGG